MAPDWLRGDRFDALMNYPLGEAILGFAGGSHLDMGVVARPPRVLGERPPARRSGLRRAAHGARRAYDPAVLPVQLNLLGSHDTPAASDDARRRRVDGVLLATLLQMTLPGAPCITTATRSA